jgi:hypothetical protein
MPVAFRKLNLFQRFQNRKQVCYICGKAPATHWSYMVNNQGQFISNPKPKYFHIECANAESDKRSLEIEEAFNSIVNKEKKG